MVFRREYKTHATSYEETYLRANYFVETAVKNGGLIFGDFVWNVIIPYKFQNKMLCELDFNKLNIWFPTDFDQSQSSFPPYVEITNTFPNDFSINLMTWNGKELKVNHEIYAFENIFNQIINKCTTILSNNAKIIDGFRIIRGNYIY